MAIPLEVTFRGLAPSPAIDLAISHWLMRLGRVYDGIQRCRVWIELPHRHQRRGAQFQVRLSLSLPGREITIGHTPGRSARHDDVYLAIADAFLAARRQLQDHLQIRRGDVKTHAA
jgi:ribosome-associated translation inhibitor RaiA